MIPFLILSVVLVAVLFAFFGTHTTSDSAELNQPNREYYKKFIPTVGAYVRDADDVKCLDPAIVVIDHAEEGLDGLYTIKRASDGKLSNRETDDLVEIAPIGFVKVWCKNQITFS